jgi:hypothetical protein
LQTIRNKCSVGHGSTHHWADGQDGGQSGIWDPVVIDLLGEHDRSATGYLPKKAVARIIDTSITTVAYGGQAMKATLLAISAMDECRWPRQDCRTSNNSY